MILKLHATYLIGNKTNHIFLDTNLVIWKKNGHMVVCTSSLFGKKQNQQVLEKLKQFSLGTSTFNQTYGIEKKEYQHPTR